MKPIKDIKIAIISGAFWEDIVGNLEKHCLEALNRKGLESTQVEIIRVPGSFEIPLAVKKLAEKKVYDAIITFGAIHKGKTYHFELIANECARACMNLSLEFGIPVIFEVLAVYDIQDAVDRSTQIKENRGTEAGNAAMSMIAALENLK